jgi:hypothetical protein
MAKLARVVSPLEGILVSKDEKKKAAEKMAGMVPKSSVVASLPDEDEIKRKSRKAAALRFGQRGSGRASTILSGEEGKLGA